MKLLMRYLNPSPLALSTPSLHQYSEPTFTLCPVLQVVDILPSSGKHGWTKLECLKVEKGLLVYGWREWRQILRHSKFKKRRLGLRDVENIARHIVSAVLLGQEGGREGNLFTIRGCPSTPYVGMTRTFH